MQLVIRDRLAQRLEDRLESFRPVRGERSQHARPDSAGVSAESLADALRRDMLA